MTPRLLGVVALVLGSAAALVRPRSLTLSTSTAGLSYDRILPESLAATIMADGTGDMTLIDLRPPAEFERYHIPGSRQVAESDLQQGSIPSERTIVLYDSSEAGTAPTWLLLKSQGYPRIFVLAGGLARWEELILHPALPPGSSRRSSAEFSEEIERSRFFGGSPVPAPTRPSATPVAKPDTSPGSKPSFDIGPGGCFY